VIAAREAHGSGGKDSERQSFRLEAAAAAPDSRRMQARWLALALLGGCTDLPYGEVESDVIGGKMSSPGDFPGVGALMYSVGGATQAGCTGTLIAPDLVMTAAHCLDPDLVGPNNTMPSFTLALDTTTGSPPLVASKASMKHEMFTLNGVGGTGGLQHAFDVGLLFLAQPITEVAPVPMPRPADAAEIVANLDMQIAGYGTTMATGQSVGILFDAQTKLVSLNDTEIQIGMGAPQPQNCHGDSGGPGFATVGGVRRVIGIVSRSFMGGECTNGGIDTRVDAYTDWIVAHAPAAMFPCDSGRAEACPPPDGGDDAGCCSSSSRSAPASAVLALLVGLALVRRRAAA
jgi:endonuclease G